MKLTCLYLFLGSCGRIWCTLEFLFYSCCNSTSYINNQCSSKILWNSRGRYSSRYRSNWVVCKFTCPIGEHFILIIFLTFEFLGYQICLMRGLNSYLLSDERGTDLISQNKEGIFSIFGKNRDFVRTHSKWKKNVKKRKKI